MTMQAVYPKYTECNIANLGHSEMNRTEQR